MKWGSREPGSLLLKHRRAGDCYVEVIPKMAQCIDIYMSTCVCILFFYKYVHIYNTRIIRRAFMWYSCQEKGVTLELFPRIPEQTSSQLVREGEGWAEKGFVSSLGMHAAHTLPG